VTVTPEVAAETRRKAREYLTTNGTLAATPAIRKKVGNAFQALETFLASVDAATAARRAWPDEWSIHEIADHLVETHRPSLDELWCLLAGQRPPGEPIPAGLVSKAPLTRPWPWLLRELSSVHREIVTALERVADDFSTAARAPLVMVANAPDESGVSVPLHWIEELDWKAYAIVLRLHAADHLSQAKKVAAASPRVPPRA
jgi:hypothetical protein